MSSGILYGIGVGPGAPDLLTLRAINILKKTDIILAPHSPKNDYSLCLEIVKEFLPESIRQIRLDFPMTHDRKILDRAWKQAATIASLELDKGLKAAFLTLGDPLFYSTFIYFLKEILLIRPELDIEIVPGISSWQACASRMYLPLGYGNQIFKIIPGTLPLNKLQEELCNPEPLVIIKVYKNFMDILKCLEKTGRIRTAVLFSFIESGREKLTVLRDCGPDLNPPYMSLIICPA